MDNEQTKLWIATITYFDLMDEEDEFQLISPSLSTLLKNITDGFKEGFFAQNSVVRIAVIQDTEAALQLIHDAVEVAGGTYEKEQLLAALEKVEVITSDVYVPQTAEIRDRRTVEELADLLISAALAHPFIARLLQNLVELSACKIVDKHELKQAVRERYQRLLKQAEELKTLKNRD